MVLVRCELILAKTDVATLAAQVASSATTWERDVLGKSVRVEGTFGWVFRLEGHPWSAFVGGPAAMDSAAELSGRLSVPVISYGRSDTVGAIEYAYAEAGRVRESLRGSESGLTFSSELRQLQVTRENALQVADQFFRQQDAYEPGIYPEYFFADGSTVPRLEPGELRKVDNPGFVLVVAGGETRTIPRFERVDYLTFGAKSAVAPGFQVLPDQHTDFPFSVWVNWSVIALLVGAGLSLLGWRWWRRRS